MKFDLTSELSEQRAFGNAQRRSDHLARNAKARSQENFDRVIDVVQ